MARLIRRLAQHPAVHVGVGFLAMGGWAFYANSAHPWPKPMLAGLVQGALSGAITYALKRALDALRGRVAQGQGWWLPPLVALGCSLCLLVSAHWLAATPEILRTISVPYAVASTYAVTYNFLMWRSETR